MSRLQMTFDRVRQEKQGALVAYVTAGDPDPGTSKDVLRAIAEAGADVIEVGVPFSDPVADGPVIQRASERALRAGTSLRTALDLVADLRTRSEVPVVLFTYANPVLRMDLVRFATAARDVGVDGVLILDYPVEEAEPLRARLVDHGLDPIFLISPTTTDARIRRSAEVGSGFLYVISRLGVTGARAEMAADATSVIDRVRAQTSMPVALGFGISTPEQVAAACRHADAAVVGSALVNVVAQAGNGAAEKAGEFVRWLKSGL